MKYTPPVIFLYMKTIREKLENFYGANRIVYCEVNGDVVEFGVLQAYARGDDCDTWVDDYTMSINKINGMTNER